MAEEEKKDAPEQEAEKKEDGAPEGEDAPKKGGGSKKLIFIIVGVLVLIGGGVGAFLMLSGGDKEPAEEAPKVVEEKKPKPEEIEHYEFPEILVNLRSDKSKVRFLKTTLVLELGSKEDLKSIEKLTPRLQDAFQVYLRELRPSDITGPGSSDIIREALLSRAKKIADPVKVHAVLYKNFIVQ